MAVTQVRKAALFQGHSRVGEWVSEGVFLGEN
jgi:hypothetical protein